jgi:hypothetical protein
MNLILQPWLVLFAGFAGWVNRQQQQIIEYLRTENQLLKEKFGNRRILLTDDQRRRLTVKGKILGAGTTSSLPRNGITATGARSGQDDHRFLRTSAL